MRRSIFCAGGIGVGYITVRSCVWIAGELGNSERVFDLF